MFPLFHPRYDHRGFRLDALFSFSFLILSLDLGVTFLLFLDTMGACDDSMFLYFLSAGHVLTLCFAS